MHNNSNNKYLTMKCIIALKFLRTGCKIIEICGASMQSYDCWDDSVILLHLDVNALVCIFLQMQNLFHSMLFYFKIPFFDAYFQFSSLKFKFLVIICQVSNSPIKLSYRDVTKFTKWLE